MAPVRRCTDQPVRGRDRVLDGEVDAHAADRRHRVRGVADAEQTGPVPAGQPVDPHVQHRHVVPAGELSHPVGQRRVQRGHVGAEGGAVGAVARIGESFGTTYPTARTRRGWSRH